MIELIPYKVLVWVFISWAVWGVLGFVAARYQIWALAVMPAAMFTSLATLSMTAQAIKRRERHTIRSIVRDELTAKREATETW